MSEKKLKIPKFSRWNFLFLAVLSFNSYRKGLGMDTINVSKYIDLGLKTTGGIWELQKISPEIDSSWIAFCNDPKNEIIFSD